jgi:hypothetical protein
LLLHPQFHIRIAQVPSGPLCGLPVFQAVGCNSVQVIEQIPALRVGFGVLLERDGVPCLCCIAFGPWPLSQF